MKYAIAAVGLLFTLMLTSCSTQRAIAHYSGDGEIIALPDGGLIQGGGGYEVRFKKLRLDRPNSVTYRFTGLPKTAPRVDVSFVIAGQKQFHRRGSGTNPQPPYYDELAGTLAVTLREANGPVVFQFRKKLSAFIWAGNWEQQYIYDPKNVSFKASPQKHYVLELQLEPDAALKDYEGHILLRSGAREGLSIGF